MRARYSLTFLLTIVLLTAGAVFSFVRISATGDAAVTPVASTAAPPRVAVAKGGEVAEPDEAAGAAALVAPTAADYARYAAEDRDWREQHARPWTLAELRARGDGRRTPRQLMQDRVFAHTKAGRREEAIRELERWVSANPRDADAILWLARQLNEAGRTNDALARYRQVLKLKESEE